MTISDSKRELFLKSLEKSRNVSAACAEAGIARETGYRIVKSREGNDNTIRLPYPTKNDVVSLLRDITGRNSISAHADLLKMPYAVLKNFCHSPEQHSLNYSQNFIAKLSKLFPDKAGEIATLESLICFPRQSSAQLKKTAPQVEQEFRQQGVAILRDWRNACGLSLDEASRQITMPALKKNLSRIEANDEKLALSIYRDALKILPDIYARHDPVTALMYIRKLERLVGPR